MKQLGILAAVLVAVVFFAAGVGAVRITPRETFAILTHADADPQKAAVLFSIRLPRVVLGILVGAGLGVAGTATQGLFRNPLADPGLIGVSGGALLAAAVVFVVGDHLGVPPGSWLALASFAGAMGTTFLVYRLARWQSRTVVATMLLSGIALNALAQAGVGVLTFFATDTQIRSISFWRLGALAGATWGAIYWVAPFVLVPVLALPWFAPALNAFQLGESEAFHLGVSVERVKNATVLLAAMAAGASVAVTGIIGFIGLIVPHVVRLLLGPDHRRLIPGSALFGAALTVGADMISRTIVTPAELPIGIITAVAGAPFFLWLLLRGRRYA